MFRRKLHTQLRWEGLGERETLAGLLALRKAMLFSAAAGAGSSGQDCCEEQQAGSAFGPEAVGEIPVGEQRHQHASGVGFNACSGVSAYKRLNSRIAQVPDHGTAFRHDDLVRASKFISESLDVMLGFDSDDQSQTSDQP
jgi:hypothetical protein